jgi:hypothetical protein
MSRSKSNADEVAEYEGGKATGQRWVTQMVTPQEELARLYELWNTLEDTVDWGEWFSNGPNDAYSTAERLYFVLAPDHDGDRDEAQSFWEAVLFPEAADDLTPEFVEGFVEGALEASDEAKAKV